MKNIKFYMIIGLLLACFIITPIEAHIFNRTMRAMFLVNIIEILLFAIGLYIGTTLK